MADEDKGASKYAYLLQPIKDLERNFAINIVELLEEYTKTLDAVAAAENFQIDNAHRFNFAEAAMLIHGSANVFGKKVDLIHNQALNFFEVLKITKDKKKKNKGDDDEDEGIGGDDQMDPFVPVDPCILQNFSKLKPAQLPSLISKNQQQPIPSISIMPMSLMPLADFEKCNVPIYNSKNKNEVVGKKDDFKINTGYMSKTGALLLDLLNEKLTNLFVTEKRINTTEVDRDSGCSSPMNDPGMEADLPPYSQQFDPGRPSNAIEMVRRAAGPSLDSNTLLHRPSSVHLIQDGKNSQPLAVLAEEFSNSDFGGDFNDDDYNIPEASKKKKDPWEMDDDGEIDPVIDKIEDPFEEVNWKQKPYREGKNTINVVTILEKKKKEYDRKDPKEKVMEFIDFVNDQIMFLGKKQKLKRELGLGTQHKWEDAILPYIAAQQKRRMKARREILAHRRAEEKVAIRQRGKPPIVAEYDEDDDFAADAFDDAPIDENQPINRLINSSTIQRPLMADVEDDDLAGDLNFPAVFVDPVSQNPDLLMNMGKNTEGIHDGMSVEQIIAFYRIRYWEQTAEAMSKLAARVQEWDEKMQPILEKEEQRKEFDIHEYGDELIDFFDEIEQERELPQLLRGKKEYEISRYFLSTLMMANTMNVEIIAEQQSGPDPLKMMRVKLLKRERHHNIFDQNGAM